MMTWLVRGHFLFGGGGGNHPCLNYKLESCFGYQIFSWSSVNKYWQADLWSTWHSTDQQPPPQRVKDTFLKEQKAWFSSLLVYVDTGHLWRSWSHFQWASGRLVFLAENPFAMAAAIGTHGTVGVADLCQHSLTSTALVEASSRTPLERNKREMLYTLMTFPQWLSKTTASLKLLGTGWRRVHTAQQRKKKYRVHCLSTLQSQPKGGNNQIFIWYEAYRGQPQYCPYCPPSIRLFLWIYHKILLRYPHNPD